MKIALVGSAPSSIDLAPFDDPRWQIWGCSPGAYPHLRRVDAFFEIHRWRPGEDGFSPQYIEWMSKLECPVYTIERRDDIPNSVPYPTETILAQYPGLARSFFTSSLAWMMALAIANIEERRKQPAYVYKEGDDGTKVLVDGQWVYAASLDAVKADDGEDEIGFWGVDMAANDEWGHQKPGCHFFIDHAQKRGIRVTVPPQSDLLRPIPLYGIGEAHPMRIKLGIRMQELQQRHAEVQARMANTDKAYQEARGELLFLQGAMDDLQYMMQTWVD